VNVKWADAIRDESGLAIDAVTISVKDPATNALIPIFSDEAGTAKANPFTTGANGIVSFYVNSTNNPQITIHAAKVGHDFTVWNELFSNVRLRLTGTGDVTGPASAVDGNLAAFDGATGKLIKDSGNLVTNLFLGDTTKQALSSSVAAQTIYVDAVAGSNTTGDGSAGAPFATVQHAVNSLPRVITRATTIAVSAGTYDETISLTDIEVLSSLTFKAMDTSNNDLFGEGTATGGTATTLADTSKSWAANIFTNGKIFIWNGTGRGQIRDISNNTATEITVSTSWTTIPDATSKYVIVSPAKFSAATRARGIIINGQANVNVYGFQFSGYSTEAIRLSNARGINVFYNYMDNVIWGIYVIGKSQGAFRFNFIHLANTEWGGITIDNSYASIRDSALMPKIANQGTGVLLRQISFAMFWSSLGNLLIQDANIGIEMGQGSQPQSLNHIDFVNVTTNIRRADLEIKALNPTGGNVLINTTTGNNILTVQQTSATDPIADAWITYSLRKEKTILKDVGVLNFDEIPARRWKRKLTKPKLTDFEEETEDGRVRTREEQLADALEEYTKKKSSQKFNQEQFGLIAEEAPDCLKAYDDTGELVGINTSAYIGWLHAVVKEQNTTIKDLTIRVQALEQVSTRNRSKKTLK